MTDRGDRPLQSGPVDDPERSRWRTPPPSKLQRWSVRHGRAIRVFTAVYLIVVLAVQGWATALGEGSWFRWLTTAGCVFVGANTIFVLLPNIERYVQRWDAARDERHP